MSGPFLSGSCLRPIAEVIKSSTIAIFAAILALVFAAVRHERHILIAPAIVQAPIFAVRGGALFRPRRVERTVDVGLVASVLVATIISNVFTSTSSSKLPIANRSLPQ